MSDFFRITTPPEIAAATLHTLARLTHEAEEIDDDVLFLQVQGAVQARGSLEQEIYRAFYLEQWKAREDARAGQNTRVP